MKMTMKKAIAVLLVSVFGVLPLTACDNEGPAEELGEKVDEAARDAKRSLEDAAD